MNLSRRSTQRIEFSSRDFNRAPVGRSKPGVEPALVRFRVSDCVAGVVKVGENLQSRSSVEKTNVADTVQPVFQRRECGALREEHENAVETFIQVWVFFWLEKLKTEIWGGLVTWLQQWKSKS